MTLCMVFPLRDACLEQVVGVDYANGLLLVIQRDQYRDLIVFHNLTPEQLRQIVDLMIDNLNNRLSEKNLSINVKNRAKDRLAKDGFSEIYGARPLKRLIEDQIENIISMKIISGEFDFGEKMDVDFARGKFTFKKFS